MVDLRKPLYDPIVVPVEHDQIDASSGWLVQKPVIRKRIGLQFTILERPNRVLGLLVISVQDLKIEI